MAIKGAEGYKTAEQKELSEMNKLSDNLNSVISGIGSEGGKEPVVITGVITFGDLAWSNNKASVTVNKGAEDSLSIEYQVLDKDNQIISDYQLIANGQAVTNLSLGDFVIVRLTDGQKHGNTASIEVTDGTEPTINATTGTVTTNSIQVTGVSAVDNEAGMPNTINYSYYIKASTAGDYETAKYTGTETIYNFTGLTRDTSYDIKITVADTAGNLGEKELTGIKTNPNTAPQFTEDSVKVTRTATGMSIEAIATDSDNDNITYTLEWGNTTSYGKSKPATVASGKKVTIAFDGVAKTDNIYWRLTGSDGIGVTGSKTGTSEYCSGLISGTRKCTHCNRSSADMLKL